MTFHGGDMNIDDIHGTQLRMITDELENGVNNLETRTDFYVRRAEAILGALVTRNAARAQADGEILDRT